MRDGDIVLGIETSCDETAVALVRADRRVLSAPLFSQLAEHAPYGGVVPEIAARAHVEKLDLLVAQAMREAGIGFGDLAGVAATAGPGLIGGLMVGLLTGKTIALVHDLPLVAVNHLEAHALTARFVAELDFPYLLLLVSGGHCQLVAVEGVGRYRQLGTTIDDALGEAFDKVAKMLGLGYPGGPAVERLAQRRRPRRGSTCRARCRAPRPATSPSPASRPRCATGSSISARPRASPRPWPTCAPASRPRSATCWSTARCVPCACCGREHPSCRTLVVAGGVAANLYLRQRLEQRRWPARASPWSPRRWRCAPTTRSWSPGPASSGCGWARSTTRPWPARARWPLEELTPPSLSCQAARTRSARGVLPNIWR